MQNVLKNELPPFLTFSKEDSWRYAADVNLKTQKRA